VSIQEFSQGYDNTLPKGCTGLELANGILLPSVMTSRLDA
jgi:hypothetical protein